MENTLQSIPLHLHVHENTSKVWVWGRWGVVTTVRALMSWNGAGVCVEGGFCRLIV